MGETEQQPLLCRYPDMFHYIANHKDNKMGQVASAEMLCEKIWRVAQQAESNRKTGCSPERIP